MVETHAAIGAETVSRDTVSSPPATLLAESEFQDLYRQHARALWGYLYRLTGNAADADDLLQDSFCRLLASPLATRDDQQIRAYLFRIASNLAIDHWRRAGRGGRPRLVEHADESHAQPATADHGAAATLRHDMSRTLRELKPQERVLLWLAHVEGSEHRDIAATLGLKAASVPVLLHRARRKLAGLLRKKGLGPGER
jgi:RNA polymerase sigma-70 factor, ECF subfamily